MLELKARFTLALTFTTWPTLGRGKQEVSLLEGAGEGTGISNPEPLFRRLAGRLQGSQNIVTSAMSPSQLASVAPF
jgi:hypothetical protein